MRKGQAWTKSANKTFTSPCGSRHSAAFSLANCLTITDFHPFSAAIYDSAFRYHKPPGEAMLPWKGRRRKSLIREQRREEEREMNGWTDIGNEVGCTDRKDPEAPATIDIFVFYFFSALL